MSENNLTEKQRRLLTEWLGECYHEPDRDSAVGCYQGEYTVRQTCEKCGKILSTTEKVYLGNRTFDTWQDLGDLKEKLVEKGLWINFEGLAYKSFFNPFSRDEDDLDTYYDQIIGAYTEWLMDPARILLVAEFKPWER